MFRRFEQLSSAICWRVMTCSICASPDTWWLLIDLGAPFLHYALSHFYITQFLILHYALSHFYIMQFLIFALCTFSFLHYALSHFYIMNLLIFTLCTFSFLHYAISHCELCTFSFLHYALSHFYIMHFLIFTLCTSSFLHYALSEENHCCKPVWCCDKFLLWCESYVCKRFSMNKECTWMQKVYNSIMCVTNSIRLLTFLVGLEMRQQRWWQNKLLNRTFSIASESTNFRIKFSHYNGTAGDAMSHGNVNTNLNNQPFTTVDRDNDR